MNHLKTYRGEYVDLRPLVRSDAAITFQWRQSRRAQLLNQGAKSVEQQARWIASRPDNELNFIIQTKAGVPIGMLSLIGIDQTHRHAEPARFLIGDEERAKGIPAAVEAMKILYKLAFDALKLERVHGTIASDNTPMITWQKYLGMKEEGRLRRHYFIHGHFQDAVCVGLLLEEYRTVTLPRMKALLAAGAKGKRG